MTPFRRRGHAGEPRIFLSYRRDDAAGHAGRLHDALLEHFGRDQIFMDIDTLEPGLDFVESIERALSQCDVLLVLIGTRWLAEPGSNGRRRLDDPGDYVRLEVASGLARADLRVVPVLIQGARMPASEDLPEDLRSLVRRNAFEVSDTRWQFDISQLIEQLKKIKRKGAIAGPVAAASTVGEATLTAAPTVRFRGTSRLGVTGALVGLGVTVALLLAVMSGRPTASITGSSAGSLEPSAAHATGPPNTAPATAVATATSSARAPGATSPLPVEGSTVVTFESNDDAETGRFTVDESWSLEWSSEAYFALFVSVADDRSVFHLDGLREDGSTGVTPMYATGTFYLTVFATGPWTVIIRDMAEWPRTTLPYSLTGEGSLNTPVFEQTGTTRVCWESDGDSSFYLDLLSLSGRGQESAQAAVIETGATTGCTDLEARSPEAFLQVVTLSGTWSISAE